MELAGYCKNLSDAAAEAEKWVDRNPELVRNEREGLLKELRRAGRLFRSCGRAAGRKMCAGVFGPSQAGKSYLISAIARGGKDKHLLAKFAGKNGEFVTHDFLMEINPEGGKEATGLVTRFTMDFDPASTPECPVCVRLLSETDLVKIVGNSWFADCEHNEERKSRPAETLAELRKNAAAPNNVVDINDMEDLQEYFDREFSSRPGVRELRNNFWNEAIQLAPRLGLDDRVTLYSLIWDRNPKFTSIFARLAAALQRLGHPDRLYCGIDSLIPRNNSIIDVATLNILASDAQEGSVDVLTPSGQKSYLPRSVLAALVAELVISMVDKPADFFDHTDLLDFPGYRSRMNISDLDRALENNDEMLAQLYLRGKVAYLFQRYCAEHELNSMLLCIGPSNQEVRDLPKVINKWVNETHGETPEEREGKQVSLLFVLTKFDMEFEQKKGVSDLKMRWDIRLDASLLDFFGKEFDWPQNWTPGHGFNNMFMLRNPNFKFGTVLAYNGDIEAEIRPESRKLVDDLHSAFINSAKVARHFRDPQRAWQEAMRLNDGGITWIRENLSPLCNPKIKETQLLANINSCRASLDRRLRAFYRSDDREELRKQKKLLVRRLIANLNDLEKSRQRMGELLRSITIADSQIQDLHPEAARRHRELVESREAMQNEEQAAKKHELENMDADIDLDDDLDFIAALKDEVEEPQKVDEEVQLLDEDSFYAAYIEEKWVENLHILADNPIMQKYFMMPAHDFGALAGELATGLARMRIKDKLTEAFHNASSFSEARRASVVSKQAAIAARMLNDYIGWLGFNPQTQSENDRTVNLAAGKTKVLFQPHEIQHGLPKLSEENQPYSREWFFDWLYALNKLVMDNVNFDGEKNLNVEENAALGSILHRIEKDYRAQAA